MKIFYKISVVTILAVVIVFGLAGLISRAATAVSLNTADNFAVLAGTGITFGGAVNTTTINGDIGTYPTATITGIGNVILTGTNHAGDAVTQTAKTDLTTAYNAAGQTPTLAVTELAGTKTPGVYNSADGTFGLTGTLILDAQGNPNAVFIFRTTTTLITAGASNMVLANGAQACNVFWQVGSSATLGAASFFKGNILALASIGLGTTANVEGRVLARNAAVTLDGSNIINRATCLIAPPAAGSSGGQGNPPLISVTKIPTPLALPAGPGSVTYNYTVLNVGTAAMSNVTVTDNKCAPVVYISGDTNGDGLLDERQAETWRYRCTTTVSQTTTNTVTATGQANGYTAIDTANATVVVSVPIIPPLIHLVKTPNIFLLSAPGGAVTYTYIVTNPGTAPLSDVSITDDKCTGLPGRVVGHPGDINKNNLLDPGEAWQFTCQTNITQTTINTGTAEGSANGLTAIDFSPATVAVSPTVVAPKLPNTGFPPEEKSIPWNIIIPSGIFVALIFFYFARRKQTA